ncbi:YkvA family protein [Anoxybacteroides tepidamans]|uniref:YkvA family protein n=1 Tax=Anoxybacteroides tepidamans TaxID=265948 RepID=UPI000488791F|nr:YkvA family protein [Anoxybacillus tepidamans]
MGKVWKQARLLLKIRRLIPFIIEFFRSHEVAFFQKAIYMLGIIGYFLFPFDLVPDWIGIFGLADDITILMLILQKMIKDAPDHLKQKYGM